MVRIIIIINMTSSNLHVQGCLLRDKELLSLDLSVCLESKWQPLQSDSGDYRT